MNHHITRQPISNQSTSLLRRHSRWDGVEVSFRNVDYGTVGGKASEGDDKVIGLKLGAGRTGDADSTDETRSYCEREGLVDCAI